MSKDISACFSHKTDDWRTPGKLYYYFIAHDYIDPCPYKSDQDNLSVVYHNKKLFINPPFSKLSDWVSFIEKNSCDNVIVLLVPSRTDTHYFHRLLALFPLIVFVEGRFKFNDGKFVAPFPTMFMIFNPNERKQEYTFCSEDEVIRLC